MRQSQNPEELKSPKASDRSTDKAVEDVLILPPRNGSVGHIPVDVAQFAFLEMVERGRSMPLQQEEISTQKLIAHLIKGEEAYVEEKYGSNGLSKEQLGVKYRRLCKGAIKELGERGEAAAKEALPLIEMAGRSHGNLNRYDGINPDLGPVCDRALKALIAIGVHTPEIARALITFEANASFYTSEIGEALEKASPGSGALVDEVLDVHLVSDRHEDILKHSLTFLIARGESSPRTAEVLIREYERQKPANESVFRSAFSEMLLKLPEIREYAMRHLLSGDTNQIGPGLEMLAGAPKGALDVMPQLKAIDRSSFTDRQRRWLDNILKRL